MQKVPLVPLPIMDEPFGRIAMDIWGFHPVVAREGICDYTIRYPEAVALRTIHVNAVAEELLSFFAHVGLPEDRSG